LLLASTLVPMVEYSDRVVAFVPSPLNPESEVFAVVEEGGSAL
jgi:hypothetical protein